MKVIKFIKSLRARFRDPVTREQALEHARKYGLEKDIEMAMRYVSPSEALEDFDIPFGGEDLRKTNK